MPTPLKLILVTSSGSGGRSRCGWQRVPKEYALGGLPFRVGGRHALALLLGALDAYLS